MSPEPSLLASCHVPPGMECYISVVDTVNVVPYVFLSFFVLLVATVAIFAIYRMKD